MNQAASDGDARNTEARALIDQLKSPPRWLGPWSYYVLAALVGSALASHSALELGALFIGIPLSSVTDWIGHRIPLARAVAVITLITVGLLVGLFQ